MAYDLSRRGFVAGLSIGISMPALAQPLRKVRISTLPSVILFPTYVARDLGLFRDLGIEAEFVIARGGSEVIQLMVSGAADVANAGVEHVFKLRETGLDAKVLSVQEGRYITELVVHTKHKNKIKSLKDLKGMTIGVSGTGSGSHVCSRYILKEAGLDPELDVSFVSVGGPATQVKAFEQGQVEALMAYDPAQSILKYGLKIAYPVWSGVAGDPPPLFQDFAMECLAASAAWIGKNPDLAADVVRANVKAIDLIRSGDPRVLDVYAGMFPGIDREILRRSLNEHIEAFSPILTRKGVANVSAYGKFAGVTTRDITYEEAVAQRFEELWTGWRAPAGKSF